MSTASIGNNIVALLQQQGENAARARAATGQIWSGAIQSIGQSVGGAIQQANDPKAQLAKIQLDDAKRTQAGQRQLASMMGAPPPAQGPVEPGQPPPPSTNPNLDENGLFNIPRLAKGLAASGFADKAPELLKSAEMMNDSITKSQEHDQQAAQTKTVLFGDAANGLQKAIKAGIPPDQAYDFVTMPLVASKRFAPQEIAATKAKLLALPPDQMSAALDQLKAAADKVAPAKDLAKDAVRPSRYGETLLSNVAPPKPGEGEYTINGQRFGANGKPIGTAVPLQAKPEDVETARHNQAMEGIGRMTAGREAAAQVETARHNHVTEQQGNPLAALTGGAAGANGAPSNLHGDEFLATLNPAAATEVKAYAEGRRPFPTGMSTAKLEPLIQAVGQYDPSFDAANYNARNKARTDLTNPSGKGGAIVNSLNTAIQHAGKLSDLIEAEGNTNSPAYNSVANWLATQTGSTKVTNFDAVQPQLMKEVERLWRGAGGGEGDINALKASLGKNMGIQQQREALDQFVGLMEGKLQSTEQQRDNVLGPAAKDVPILFDQSKPVLAKIAQRASGATAAPTASGPAVGQEGVVNGVPAIWDGKGWKAKPK